MSHDGRVEVVVVVDDEKDDDDEEDDGTLVETPTRCNNTKNNREERVRISRAIRTGVAGRGGGLGWHAAVAVRRKRRFMEFIIGDDDDDIDAGPSSLGGGGGDIAAAAEGSGVGIWSMFGGREETDVEDRNSSLSPPPSLSTFRDILDGCFKECFWPLLLLMLICAPWTRFVFVVVAVTVMVMVKDGAP